MTPEEITLREDGKSRLTMRKFHEIEHNRIKHYKYKTLAGFSYATQYNPHRIIIVTVPEKIGYSVPQYNEGVPIKMTLKYAEKHIDDMIRFLEEVKEKVKEIKMQMARGI